MAEEEEEKGRGFRVEDRRRFSPTTGEPRTRESSEQPAESAPTNEAESSYSSRVEAEQEAFASSPAELSFSSFLLGLSTQALIYMGEVPQAPEQPVQTDLSAAQQMIDVLALLQRKTKGNLDKNEEAMLENVLFDLRMRYVDLVKKGREIVRGEK